MAVYKLVESTQGMEGRFSLCCLHCFSLFFRRAELKPKIDMGQIKVKKFLLLACASIAIVFGFLWTVVFFFRVLSGEYAFNNKFEKVAMGFDETQVVALLGNPGEKGNEFRIGHHDGFEEAYKNASDSNAQVYWFWFREPDSVYAIGFDKHGKVLIAEYGGT